MMMMMMMMMMMIIIITIIIIIITRQTVIPTGKLKAIYSRAPAGKKSGKAKENC